MGFGSDPARTAVDMFYLNKASREGIHFTGKEHDFIAKKSRQLSRFHDWNFHSSDWMDTVIRPSKDLKNVA